LITGALWRVVTLIIVIVVVATAVVVIIIISAILIRVEFSTICYILDVFEISVWYFILDFILRYN